MKCQAVCEVNAQLVTSIINANKGLHDCKWFFLNRHKKMLILEKVIGFFFFFLLIVIVVVLLLLLLLLKMSLL